MVAREDVLSGAGHVGGGGGGLGVEGHGVVPAVKRLATGLLLFLWGWGWGVLWLRVSVKLNFLCVK